MEQPTSGVHTVDTPSVNDTHKAFRNLSFRARSLEFEAQDLKMSTERRAKIEATLQSMQEQIEAQETESFRVLELVRSDMFMSDDGKELAGMQIVSEALLKQLEEEVGAARILAERALGQEVLRAASA